MWSFRDIPHFYGMLDERLNPCFVGMWSFSFSLLIDINGYGVLILVLLGCGLLDVHTHD